MPLLMLRFVLTKSSDVAEKPRDAACYLEMLLSLKSHKKLLDCNFYKM